MKLRYDPNNKGYIVEVESERKYKWFSSKTKALSYIARRIAQEAHLLEGDTLNISVDINQVQGTVPFPAVGIQERNTRVDRNLI